MLWKGVYPHKYIDDWEKFSETSLSEKEDSSSNLNMEGITDPDHTHEKETVKNLK